MSFAFYKNEEQEGKTGPVWGAGTRGKGKDLRKECRRLSMMETLYTHVYKWKNEICGRYSRNGRKEDKRRMMERVNSTMM
jgi:hypothetical protein